MKVTQIHRHKGRKYGFSKKHGWLAWHNSDLGAPFCGWLPINEPKHMLNDEKTKYLYAFEDAFRKRCLAAKIDPSRWKMGMWANAHMYHGMGLPVEEAVDKWFQHVADTEHRKALR